MNASVTTVGTVACLLSLAWRTLRGLLIECGLLDLACSFWVLSIFVLGYLGRLHFLCRCSCTVLSLLLFSCLKSETVASSRCLLIADLCRGHSPSAIRTASSDLHLRWLRLCEVVEQEVGLSSFACIGVCGMTGRQVLRCLLLYVVRRLLPIKGTSFKICRCGHPNFHSSSCKIFRSSLISV